MALMQNLAVAFYLLCLTSTRTVLGVKPHFTLEPGLIFAYQEEAVNFTWKLSNHSLINTLYFGTWRDDIGTLGNNIMSLIRNGSKISIYTSGKEKVKEYKGRVRWTGDLSTGVASFELTNIKQTDQKYYGVEADFDDDIMTEVGSFTQLVVKAFPKIRSDAQPSRMYLATAATLLNDKTIKDSKTRSVFTSATSHIIQAARGSAYFTWRYSLIQEDLASLSALVFGVYKKNGYGILCTHEIREKAISSSFNCSTGIRKANTRFISASPTSMATFILDNLSPEDEGVYSLKLRGTREAMENKTRLLIRGVEPHFTSEPDKLIEAYQEETANFTWKLSNHFRVNNLYFGTWQADIGTLGNNIMSLILNGNKTSIYTSGKEKVKEYKGRVRWTGDLSTGVASFELTNIKQTDQKYYGVEIEFEDDKMTEVCSFTQLVVKSKSVVVRETNLCDLNNGGCSHECVFSSVTKSQTCKCPTGMDLSSDTKTCAMVHVPATTTIPPSAAYPPKSGAVIAKGPAVMIFLFTAVASIFFTL